MGTTVRGAVQALELIRTGQLVLPLAERQLILDVRTGKYTLPEVVELIESLTATAEAELEHCDLPELVNMSQVNQILDEAYHMAWDE